MDPSRDPSNEEIQWCADQRVQVVSYMADTGADHGDIGEWPAWHIEPLVSVWAIESRQKPGWVGWWAICGDLPTDYVGSSGLPDPRSAVRAIATNWLEVSRVMATGDGHPTMQLCDPSEWPEVAPLLQSRAETLIRWVDDSEIDWAESPG